MHLQLVRTRFSIPFHLYRKHARKFAKLIDSMSWEGAAKKKTRGYRKKRERASLSHSWQNNMFPSVVTAHSLAMHCRKLLVFGGLGIFVI